MQTTTYKQTPIGLIPTDWEVRKLGEIVDYKKGFAFQTTQYRNVGVRIIRVSDTNAEGIKKDGNVYIDINEAKNHSEYQLLENDIVIQTVGSRPPLYDSMVGKTIMVNKEFEGSLLNQNAVRLRERNGNNYFLFSLFRRKEYFDFIETLVRGNANQVSITLNDLFKYEIPYPKSLPEQQKIATILSTWDAAIDKCKVISEQLKVRNKGLAQQLLTGKIRVKGFEKTKWKNLKLSQLGKVISGLTYSPNDISEDGVLVLRSSNIQNQRLDFKSCVYVNIENGNFNPVKQNDILICVRNGSRDLIGKNLLIPKELEGVAFGAFMSIFRSELYFYLIHLFDSDFYYKEVEKNLGATINSINGSDLLNFQFPIPDNTEEQKAIANILDAATAELNQYQQKLQTLQHQKKGLMQQLLTGKTRVKI